MTILYVISSTFLCVIASLIASPIACWSVSEVKDPMKVVNLCRKIFGPPQASPGRWNAMGIVVFFFPPFFWGKMTNANFMTEKLLVGESLSLLVGWVKTVQGDGTAAAPKRSRPSLMSRSHCMSNWQGWWNAQKQQPTNVVNRKPCKPNKKRARKHSSIHQHQNWHFKHHSRYVFFPW